MDRTDFLAERRSGIGGSDVHHLFSLAPYGCRLRLWKEKRGVEPDYPLPTEGVLKRGLKLETIIAEEYAEKTGRTVYEKGLERHEDHPELIVHVDRMILDPARELKRSREEVAAGADFGVLFGVLECKTAGREMFFKMKREGLPDGYILQLQHGMLVTASAWGSFAVLHPDSWSLLHWDVEADAALQKEIQDAALAFWATVENGPEPERLDPDAKQCQQCPYRLSCQGEALLEAAGERQDSGYDASLGPLVAEFAERSEMAKEAAALLDETKEALKAALGDRTEVRAPGAKKIIYRSFRKEEYVVKAHVERPLRVYLEG